MSFYASRALGHMRGLGAFGISGREIFPNAPAGFTGSDTPDVWIGANSGFTGNGWIPPNPMFLKQAGDIWYQVQNSAAPANMNFAATMGAKLIAQAATVDRTVGDHSMLGYTTSATQAALAALNALKASVIAVASYQVAPEPVTPVLPGPSPSAGVPQSTAVPYQSTTSGSGVTILGSSQGAATGAAGGDNTLLYVGLGIGAVVLIGGGLLYARKRKSVAGYRRRRR